MFRQKLIRELAVVLVIKLIAVFTIKAAFFSAPEDMTALSVAERLQLNSVSESIQR